MSPVKILKPVYSWDAFGVLLVPISQNFTQKSTMREHSPRSKRFERFDAGAYDFTGRLLGIISSL